MVQPTATQSSQLPTWVVRHPILWLALVHYYYTSHSSLSSLFPGFDHLGTISINFVITKSYRQIICSTDSDRFRCISITDFERLDIHISSYWHQQYFRSGCRKQIWQSGRDWLAPIAVLQGLDNGYMSCRWMVSSYLVDPWYVELWFNQQLCKAANYQHGLYVVQSCDWCLYITITRLNHLCPAVSRLWSLLDHIDQIRDYQKLPTNTMQYERWSVSMYFDHRLRATRYPHIILSAPTILP
jgi:hypothetical protein